MFYHCAIALGKRVSTLTTHDENYSDMCLRQGILRLLDNSEVVVTEITLFTAKIPKMRKVLAKFVLTQLLRNRFYRSAST
jgi:hypothetical protein